MNKFYLRFIISAIFAVIFIFLANSLKNTYENSSRFKHDIVGVKLENRSSTAQKKNDDILENVMEYIGKRFRVELEEGIPVRQDLYGDLTTDDFLSKFVLQNNGKPFQTILFSTWRSGSSFTGDLLASVPNTLYYFEPLVYMFHDNRRVRGPPQRENAIKCIQALLTCNHHSIPMIRETLRTTDVHFIPNLYRDEVCGMNESLCRNTEFTNMLCRMSPIHLIKLVRLPLEDAEHFLTDTPNLKILYLVRDPRGIINSRWISPFLDEDERDPSILCGDLESEFYAAKHLIRKYPNRFKVVRYEDLAENTHLIAKELLNFLGLEMHPKVMKFIEMHTGNVSIEEEQNIMSTHRQNSFNTAVRWRNELPFSVVQKIQSLCSSAMQLWGYKMATNSSEMQNFTPYLKRDEYVVENVISS